MILCGGSTRAKKGKKDNLWVLLETAAAVKCLLFKSEKLKRLSGAAEAEPGVKEFGF